MAARLRRIGGGERAGRDLRKSSGAAEIKEPRTLVRPGFSNLGEVRQFSTLVKILPKGNPVRKLSLFCKIDNRLHGHALAISRLARLSFGGNPALKLAGSRLTARET